MKRILVVLLGIVPIMLSAQHKCVYFDKMVELKVEKTDINTTNSDFGPSFVADELWYSAFTDEEIEKLSRGVKKDIFYNLFTTSVDKSGNITGGKSTKLEEQSEGYHAGPVAYCEATGELFVTLSNFENPEVRNKVYQKADVRLKIIVAKEVEGEWTKVADLPFNSPHYSIGHPAVSVTGDTLFFVSNAPDTGLGGTDIYMAVRTDGQWGEMKNLGDKINTPEDDMFPFLYKNHILVFASKGRGEGNDLDMYYAGMGKEGFSEPTELSALNSDGDDFGFVIHSKGEVGYFTSNREGGIGHDDIYKVLIDPIYDLELVVMDKKSGEQIENAKIGFDDLLLAIEGLIFKRRLAKNKTYTVKTDMDGYMNDSKTISTAGKPFGLIRDTLWVEKVVVGQKFVMENIYYDFDKWDILPESEVELDKLVKVMNDNPGWKVELGSHTDSRGSDAYNEKLSQKRSDSAVAYIVSKGIAAERIIAKGYGESQLVNHCSNGVDCTEEEHRQNRRTEFKILEME